MSTQPFDQQALQEFLLRKRAQEALGGGGVTLAPPTQDLSQVSAPAPNLDVPAILAGQSLAPAQQAPVPDSPIDTYTKAIQNQPKITDFHPSFMRKLGGVLAGVGTGLSKGGRYDTGQNPADVREQVTYAPFIRQAQHYQQSTIDPSKLLAEGYMKEQAQKALQEQEQAHAEAFRAEVGKYGAEQTKAEKETAGLPSSYEEGLAGKIKLAEVEHPDTAMPKLYDLTLADGTKLKGVERTKSRQYIYKGQIISPAAITEASEQGAPKEPTNIEDRYINAMKLKLGRELTPEEYIEANRKFKQSGAVVHVDVGGFKQQAALDRGVKQYGAPYQKDMNDMNSQMERIDEALITLKTGGYTGQNLSQIKLLTATVSGKSTGVRVTKQEIDQIAKARGVAGSFEAFLDRMSGQGSLSTQQQQEINSILVAIKDRLMMKQEIATRAYNKMENAGSREEIIKADQEARAIQAAMEHGLYKTGILNGKKVYTIDGGKTVLPFD